MIYHGIVSNGVVVLLGDKPVEGTPVEVTPVSDSPSQARGIASHPALGMWKNRTDLPDDSVEASKVLRRELMGRADE